MQSFLKYMQIYNEIEQLVILLIHGKETEWIFKKMKDLSLNIN